MIERIRYGGVNNPYNYSEFVCDTVVDLADLPTTVSVDKYKKFDTCSIGSKATVISNKTTYILNSNNQWIMLNDYKTSGGSIVVDETLTESGQAADSKVVGDKFLLLENWQTTQNDYINNINIKISSIESNSVGQKTSEGGEIFNDYTNNIAHSNSHAEGSNTKATGKCAHAEGNGTTASGVGSHAEGYHTIASSDYQHVQGKFNVKDADGKYAFIIGNGTENDSSNAIAIDWNGLIYLNNSDAGIDLSNLQTKEEITQSRTDANGTSYATLKERLDSTDENIESVSTDLKDDLDGVKKITLHSLEVKPIKQYTGVRIRNTDGKFVIGTTGKVKAFPVIKEKKYTITLNNNDVFRIAYHDNLHDGSKNITDMTLVYAEDTASVYSFDNQYGNGYIYICYTFSDSEELSVLVEQTDGILEISPNETTFMEYISLETENLLQLEDRVIVNVSNKSTGELGLSILPGSIVIKNNKIDISMRLDEWGTSARRIVLKKFDILKAGTYTLSLQNHTFVNLCGIDILVNKGLPLDSNDNRLAKVSANYDVRSASFTLEEDTTDVYIYLLLYAEYSVPYCSFYLQLEEGETYTKYVNPNNGNYWTEKNAYNIGLLAQQAIEESYLLDNTKNNMAWTYGWTNPYVIKANGKIFFGYIRKNYKLNKHYIGISCTDSTGNTINLDLVESNICDDHNAPAVILTQKNKILVGCSTGHGYDNKVHIVRFRDSFQSQGTFDKVTLEVDSILYPNAKTSYSQFIKTSTGRIIIIFRVQMPENNTLWMMSYSDNDGLTWSEIIPFCNMNKYMMVRQRSNDLCAVVVGSHPTHEPHNQIICGYVNFVTGVAYGKDGVTVRGDNIYNGGFSLVENDGIDIIITGTAMRRRLIDYYPSDIGNECILFADAMDDSNEDFTYYLYKGGVIIELTNSGKPFYTASSYIGGGCIVNENTVVVSRNNDNGTWDIVKCSINNNIVAHEILVHDTVVLLRPLHIDGKIFYQSGEYNDGSFNYWSLDVRVDNLNSQDN